MYTQGQEERERQKRKTKESTTKSNSSKSPSTNNRNTETDGRVESFCLRLGEVLNFEEWRCYCSGFDGHPRSQEQRQEDGSAERGQNSCFRGTLPRRGAQNQMLQRRKNSSAGWETPSRSAMSGKTTCDAGE